MRIDLRDLRSEKARLVGDLRGAREQGNGQGRGRVRP